MALLPVKKTEGRFAEDIVIEALSEADMRELNEQYPWWACLDLHNKPFTVEEFVSHVSGPARGATRPARVEGVGLQTYEQALSDEERELVRACKRLTYIKDLRDDYRRKCVYLARTSLFSEIARRAGVDVGEISYWTEAEVLSFLRGQGKPEEVVQRMAEGFSISFQNGKTICLAGAEARQFTTTLGLQDSKLNSRGMAFGDGAVKGRASGHVKIVRGVEDLLKVEPGDVMIAETTHSDYTFVMRKAAAVVTNEGGLTSHAAIVCRGYGTPCIVGTENATKCFDDCDRVLVDADRGVVTLAREAQA